MQITKNVFLSFIMAGNSKGNTFEDWELESKHAPKFGRNWWYWKPTYSNNGGRFKSNLNTDISVYWLCFTIGITVYARGNEYYDTKGIRVSPTSVVRGFCYSNKDTGFNEISVECTDEQCLEIEKWFRSYDPNKPSKEELIKSFIKGSRYE